MVVCPFLQKKKIGGKKDKEVTGWLKPNHVTVSIKKKKEKRRRTSEKRNEVTT